MTPPRLIKRTITEELFDEAACRRPGPDDDDDAAIDDDMNDAEPTSSLHGKHRDSPTMGRIEAASTDGTDLDGEEER